MECRVRCEGDGSLVIAENNDGLFRRGFVSGLSSRMRFSSQMASLAACFCPLYPASHVICSASMELSILFAEREDVVGEVKVDPEGRFPSFPRKERAKSHLAS